MPRGCAVALFLATLLGAAKHALARNASEDGRGFLSAPRRLDLALECIQPWWDSCLDKKQPRTPIPWERSHYGNHYGIEKNCNFGVTWTKSPKMLKLMKDKKANPDDFKFKLCWADNIDANRRFWPWLYATGADWRLDTLAHGSVILTPEKLTKVWHKGYQNVMPDALDYFARMGQVADRKIIPKFMAFGWSKGATYNWPLSRWRPDIIQASVLVSGCKTKRYWKKPAAAEKASQEALAPTLFVSSENDGYVKCSHPATLDQVEANLPYQNHTYHKITKCGHHPVKCWPAPPGQEADCDLETYDHVKRYESKEDIPRDTFWGFVDFAYTYDSCRRWQSQNRCEDAWCKWDAELEEGEKCGEKYPTALRGSCRRFCGLQEVPTCTAAEDATTCQSSFEVLPIEEADADGMHVKCVFAGGHCQRGTDSFQCLFQDRCEEV